MLSVTYSYQEATARTRRSAIALRGYGRHLRGGEDGDHEGPASPWTIEVGGNTPPKMLFLEYSVRGK